MIHIPPLMKKISLSLFIVILLSGLLTLWTPAFPAEVQIPPESGDDKGIGEWWKKLEKGILDPITGTRYSWQEGLWIEGPKGNFKLKIGGKFMADGGKIDADGTMKNAFPGIENETEGFVFRYLMPYVSGSYSDHLDFKFEMDFASIRDVREIWVDFKNIPYLGHIKVGHFGQPMSLEDQASSRDITFMERALPVLAFPPGLDMGIMAINTAFGERMTWAAGYFRITGSFTNLGEARNQLGNYLGGSLAGRVTYLPIYGNEGRDLLHFGLSYNRQFIDVRRADSQVRFSARPETYLTDRRAADTEVFFAEGVEIFNPELAWVAGPLSF